MNYSKLALCFNLLYFDKEVKVVLIVIQGFNSLTHHPAVIALVSLCHSLLA